MTRPATVEDVADRLKERIPRLTYQECHDVARVCWPWIEVQDAFEHARALCAALDRWDAEDTASDDETPRLRWEVVQDLQENLRRAVKALSESGGGREIDGSGGEHSPELGFRPPTPAPAATDHPAPTPPSEEPLCPTCDRKRKNAWPSYVSKRCKDPFHTEPPVPTRGGGTVTPHGKPTPGNPGEASTCPHCNARSLCEHYRRELEMAKDLSEQRRYNLEKAEIEIAALKARAR